MAGNENKPEEVIANRIVNCGVEIWHRHLFGLKLVPELLVLAIKHLGSAEMIDGPVLGGSHKPCARIVGNA
jgi:hypothetical protein